ncbi:MAG: MCE family protein [Thermoleophilaceae bacterium]|nr:MCE family protein [Thermoleophilaceae bacterium]
MSRRRLGAITIAVLMISVFFAFTKHIPFTHGFILNAYMNDSVNIRPNSPVRIAGVTVGKVVKATRDDGSPDTKIVFDLKDKALPIHRDATLKVRPRIFLEGNFFVDLEPGSPSSPVLESGDSLPASQTAGPVQFDQLLTSFNYDTRRGLQIGLKEFAGELYRKPTPAEDIGQDPDVHGKSGFEALNGSLQYAPAALRSGSLIFRALAGEDKDDINNLLTGLRDFSEAINQNEAAVTASIVNFDTMMGAFASDEEALASATHEFSRLAIEAAPTAKQVNELLPDLTSFANLLAGGIGELPATLKVAGPWIDQTTPLLSQPELGKTASLSASVVDHFAGISAEAPSTIQQIGRISSCWNSVIYPGLIQKVADGTFSTNSENYKNFWYSLVGMASESQGFDGNGAKLRLAGAGTNTSVIPNKNPQLTMAGNGPNPELGVNPVLPKTDPPIQNKVLCYKNPAPDVNKIGKP